MDPQWLRWAKRLQAAAQNGLTYNDDAFNRERYQTIGEIAAEMMAAGSEVELEQITSLFAGQIGHATPKVDVRGAVFRHDAILLVRERSDGRWSLPGGWADVYDSPAEATVREIWEESGYRTRAVKLLALYDRTKQGHPPMPIHVYKVFFQCAIVGGEPKNSVETDGVGFFRESQLPDLSPGRVTPFQINRFFEHLRHPEWPADFD
ncbi:MAG: NUDIX hydrolase [Chloroflexota bacterium]|nr:NUDIX hydrolase [Chloroflexota bacterium]